MHARINAESVLFIMIDEQEKLCRAISDDLRSDVKANAIRLLATAREFKAPVIITEQNPEKLGPTDPELTGLLSCTPNIPDASDFGTDTPVLSKMAFSCCDAAGFDMALARAGRNRAIVFGVETHICVLSTVMDLLARGIQVVVAADACGSRTVTKHELGLVAARDCGAFVVPTETVIYQILRTADAHFKALLPFIK